jgi:putative transposase
VIYQFMHDYRHRFPISKMSTVFKVSRSGYYRWLTTPGRQRSRQNQRLKIAIHRIWEASYKNYGAPRIHRQLVNEGWHVSRPRVGRLMRAMGIASRIRNKWIKTTDSAHSYPVAANVLSRNFNPGRTGLVWVSDITYIRVGNSWLYLTVVMDLADRQIIGWTLSKTMTARQTSIAALSQALRQRKPRQGLLFHSDQGVQYACDSFVGQLKKHRLTQSMSGKGNCWDNAPAESFFKTLKHESDINQGFDNYEQARMAIFRFIEIWYNRNRLHSSLNYQTPMEAELTLSKHHRNAA